MATQDMCCSIAPYFQVHSGKMAAFKAICEKFMAKTQTEPKCLYYGFSFEGDRVHCREGYEGAEGVLAHVANVEGVLQEALQIADLLRLEVHGPASELEKLREPMASLNPQFFTLEYGFRR